MRILVLSNTPGLNVGYGTTSKYLLPLFEKQHKVALASNYGYEGTGYTYLRDFPNIRVYGKGMLGFNENTILNHYQHFEADILMPIWDIWALNIIPRAGESRQITLVPYVPLDSEIPSPDMLRALNGCFKIIPMSEHAETQFKAHYGDKVMPNIPVGVNTNIFRPKWQTMQDKGKFKSKLGFAEDDFVIGIGGDIKGQRKSFAENLEGIRMFKQKFPQYKIKVYIHTQMYPNSGADHNMQQLLNDLEMNPICRCTDPIEYSIGFTEEEMANMYNGCDVWLHASRGEGGGMMFLEAQACGTPVIGTNFTSMPQVIGKKSGIAIEPAFVGYDTIGGRKAIPSPENIAIALNEIWDMTVKNSEALKNEAREFAINFDWEKMIFPLWEKALKEIEESIETSCIKIQQPSDNLIENAKKIEVIE